jgi:hypothetical protein
MEVKAATPPGFCDRADAIVIYASLLADVDWSLGLLAQYQEDHRDHFLKVCPRRLAPGLRVSAPPHNPRREKVSEPIWPTRPLLR